uniref:PfkB family carbohydrate kinase n=1 Tax=Vaginimicrobium propionicum TaxID=1871034 RepID=UPI000970A840|nr:carbohydrate kinase family protein [Vaginimicrobium propionicum]
MINSIVVWLELPCVDYTFFTSASLSPGAKILVDRTTVLGGGVGGNYAAALRLLQVNTTAVGLGTSNVIGKLDYQDLRHRGVRVIEIPPGSGSIDPIVCTIIVPENTDRTILINYPELTERDRVALRLGFRKAICEAGDLEKVGVYLGVLRADPAASLAELSKRPNLVACTLETSDWPIDETVSALAWMDTVFVAEETYESHEAEIVSWQKQYDFDLIVTFGSKGSRLERRDGIVEAYDAASLSSQVVDTSGSGDCFAAIYCAYAWSGCSYSQAMNAAAEAAGQHVTKYGARVSPDLKVPKIPVKGETL